ncbi:NmrA-like family protein [Aspergillus japonicus CBS 114.51]|uniref:NmrA-like family protein n=1 Tax=Aspergillus japonicus CBS 114.51 TaxID=1448312 RepID=A0A8T8X8V9_ASPJA|nr:NmrA-like family protein [Aspergillus japonicus CBS 114.51]RAH84613.1 NmrA-like family protein [Aspergillus japonicus CBS 114.51]
MPKYNNVIIFGATGDVGSAAALQAHQHGATVSLATRNTSKPIPKLDHLPFQKYQADLTQPDTLRTAVRQAGAQAAFLYGIFDGPDFMRAALRALKEAGVEFIVFLSSFIILTDIHEVDPSDIVPWEHAQVEIALEEIYGSSGYVTVRPAFYASNLLHEKQAILRGQVGLPNPDATFDFISSEDIGHVAGTILVNGAQEQIVRLLGPERMTMREAVGIVGHALGKEVQVTAITREEAVAHLEAAGMPPEALTARDNIMTYAHHPPQRLQQWVENNLAKFL